MCSELTSRAPIPDGRMAQFMQPCQWNISIDFKAQFPIPSYFGLGKTLTLSYVEVALSEVSSPAPIVITSCRKNKTIITKILFLFILHLRLFSAISSQKKVGVPQLRQEFNFGWILLDSSVYYINLNLPCVSKSSFQWVRTFKIVWIFSLFINPTFIDAIFKQICDKVFPPNL